MGMEARELLLTVTSKPYTRVVQIVMEYIHGGPLTEVLGPTIDFPEPCIAYVCIRLS
jgi:hypothetical protein